jgi:hypothetical protein
MPTAGTGNARLKYQQLQSRRLTFRGMLGGVSAAGRFLCAASRLMAANNGHQAVPREIRRLLGCAHVRTDLKRTVTTMVRLTPPARHEIEAIAG